MISTHMAAQNSNEINTEENSSVQMACTPNSHRADFNRCSGERKLIRKNRTCGVKEGGWDVKPHAF